MSPRVVAIERFRVNADACHGHRFVTRRTRKALNASGGQYTRVLLLLIESGAFIAIAKISEFVLYELEPDDGLSGMNAIEIVFECMPQITVRRGPRSSSARACFAYAAITPWQGLVPTCIIYAVINGYTHQDSDYSAKSKESMVVFATPERAVVGTDSTLSVERLASDEEM